MSQTNIQTQPFARNPRKQPLIDTLIDWPEAHAPARSSVFVHNEIVIPASPEAVWAWLLRAEDWPKWYRNSADMHFLSHAGPSLRNRSRFRWNTFGVRITSKVLEFEPNSRLAWDFHGIGISGWHAWVLNAVNEPGEPPQTQVVTEETQNGWLARLGKTLAPKRLQTQHQLWLEGLSARAQAGMPDA